MSQKGMSLLELLVAVGIISIISTSVLVVLNPVAQIQKGRDGRRKAELAQIQRGIEAFYQDNNRYPNQTGSFEIQGALWGNTWLPYMPQVPRESLGNRRYVYVSCTTSDCQTYRLYANLENADLDKQSCSGGANCPNVPAGAGPNFCGVGAPSNCNYGVSSADALL